MHNQISKGRGKWKREGRNGIAAPCEKKLCRIKVVPPLLFGHARLGKGKEKTLLVSLEEAKRNLVSDFSHATSPYLADCKDNDAKKN